jgi:ParB-like chromosome segregation protein Spo0J
MSAELTIAEPSELTPEQEEASVVLTVHPLADKFPALPPDDFTKLKESIALRGQFEPSVVNAANQILDGRHRYKACIELGIEPRIVKFSVLQDASPGLTEEQFIYDSNIHRRHLTPDQRVQLEAVFLPFIKAETLAAKTDSLPKARKAKASKSVDTKSCPQKRDTKTKHANSAVGKLAAKAEVSHHKARQALKIEAVPDLADKVRNGQLTQKQANNELRSEKVSLMPPRRNCLQWRRQSPRSRC